MNKIKKYVFSRYSLIISTLIIGFIIIGSPTQDAFGGGSISVWWPVNNVTLSGVQPFKALVDNMSADKYSMFWQVDNGQLNSMDTNFTDYPHKESSVDVSGWRWQQSGTYKLNFIAKDSRGNIIAQTPITIYANKDSQAVQASLPPVQNSPAPVPVVEPVTPVEVTPSPSPLSTNQSPVPSPSPERSSPGTVITNYPAQTTSSSAQTISIWWPTDGATVTGTQPFKALIDNGNISNYKMYWSVDNGQENLMDTNYSDYPHKEGLVGLSGWNWKGTGPYPVSFTARDMNGNLISKKTISIYTGDHSSQTVSQPIQVTPAPVVQQPAPVTQPTQTQTSPIVTGNPLSGLTLYVDPNSPAANQAKNWANSNPINTALMTKIADQSSAKWLGDWNANIYQDTKNYVDAASSKGQVPVMIAYNIPQRDCGSYSAGGANSVSGYQTWITNLASGIGNRKAVVVLEPDALSMMNCLSSSDQSTRYLLINYAVDKLKANGNTTVYIDAGNSNWINFNDMAGRLKNAGINKADGFALNVSNFYPTNDLTNFGQNVSSLIGNKHFVIDTSRNGLGSNGEWCNPSGRALGTKPTTNTGNSLIDAFLWLKTPGESDGTCNGGPSAGTWWPDYAIGLSQRAAY